VAQDRKAEDREAMARRKGEITPHGVRSTIAVAALSLTSLESGFAVG
jgi:hypothetical protein